MDMGRFDLLAVGAGEALRRGAWWAVGAGAGVVPPLVVADLVNGLLADRVWPTPFWAGHAVELLGAGAVAFLVGSAPVDPTRRETPTALVVSCLAAPWPTALLQAVVEAAVLGVEPVRGLEVALRALRGPTDPAHFALLHLGSVALAVTRLAWLRTGRARLALLAGAGAPLLFAACVLAGCLAARSSLLAPVATFLAVGAVTVPGGALLAEGWLRPRLRALRTREASPS